MNRRADSDPDVEAFLAKLDERYSMTRRLQANEDALDAAWDDYRHVLARFDKPTMDRAWQLLVEGHDSWCIPTIRDVLEACQPGPRRRLRAGP